jgi:hypothetical protein
MALATWANGSSPQELVRASATLTESTFVRMFGETPLHTTLSDDLPPEPPATVDMRSLRTQLAMSPHYIVRLRKRAVEGGGAYADRVSVGRAVSADLVLRHPSVSKFHGYFSLEGQVWQLSDAASKNGSHLNGTPWSS